MAGYSMPPSSIEELVDAPTTPSFSTDPMHQWALLVEQPSLPPIEEIAREEVKLGGIRFDPILWTPSHLSFGYAPRLRRIFDGTRPVALGDDEDIEIEGLPSGAGVRWLKWRPDGGALSFVVRPDKSSSQLELWLAEFDPKAAGRSQSCIARPLVTDRTLQGVLGAPHSWTVDGRLLVKVVPSDHGAPPPKPLKPAGPAVQENIGTLKPARTYQDLLKKPYDEALFTYYLTSELLLLSTSTPEPMTIGPPEGCLLRAVKPAPDSSCVASTVLTPGEFSYLVPYRRFGYSLEVWELPALGMHPTVSGASLMSVAPDLDMRVVSKIPRQESISIARDARPIGPRSVAWHPCKPATLVLVEAVDGGDPTNPPMEGKWRDCIFTLEVRVGPSEPALSSPTPLLYLELRWAGWWFTDTGTALVTERRWKDRCEVAWSLKTDGTRTKLWKRMYQDRYGSPGSAEEIYNAKSQLVMQTLPAAQYASKNDPVVVFMGNGASPRGDRPFVDARPLSPGATSIRLWRSAAGPTNPGSSSLPPENPREEVGGVCVAELMRRAVFELPICVMQNSQHQPTFLLLRRESTTEPPNYVIRSFDTGEEAVLTDFGHPQPKLKGTRSELIQYRRADGIALTAKLYLPCNYDPVRDGPRPCLMWAYPGEFKNAAAAGQVKDSPYRFTRAHWSRPTLWLAEGWVILERFAMPILGEGDTEPNDTFVDQVVANATAAVEEVIRRGVAKRGQIAVGGHSYGAFMTAHLLAHCDLFAAGLARSGAYNRTLTPMGFQAEERDYWTVPNVYHRLSPFTYARQLADRGAPLLLVHGDNDNNAGTHPMQSERMYQAVAGQGGITKLVVLPHESHGYRARESIMHVLAEQHDWLTKWVVRQESKPEPRYIHKNPSVLEYPGTLCLALLAASSICVLHAINRKPYNSSVLPM